MENEQELESAKCRSITFNRDHRVGKGVTSKHPQPTVKNAYTKIIKIYPYSPQAGLIFQNGYFYLSVKLFPALKNV